MTALSGRCGAGILLGNVGCTMVTIKDIARLSGCAVSTVSRALNGHPDVSAETQARVQAVVAQYGFVPNNNARNLKQQASNTIGLIVKGTFNTLFSSMIEQMNTLIKKCGYTGATIYIDEDDVNEVAQAVAFCRDRKPLGLLFLGGSQQNFQNGFAALELPSVLVTTSAQHLCFKNLGSVSTDDRAAAYCAVDYLIQKGHRKIGIVGGSLVKSDTSFLRYEGCVDCFGEHGIDFDPDTSYQKARYSYHSAYKAMGRLLDQSPDLTAVFTMSDVMAIGAIRALRDRGLQVPHDISVIGFDGIELAGYYNPKLATIRQHQELLAQRGVEILLGAIEHGEQPIHELTPFSLELGESVRDFTLR